MMEKIEFNRKELFIKAASALVETLSQEFKINSFLYDCGIDIANYNNPAYIFLEKFISDYFDDKNDNVMDSLFALAEFGVADASLDEEVHDVTTVEEIYDAFCKENK